MNALHDMLADYLQIRRSQGAQFTRVGPALAHFVDFVEERGARRVTVKLALEWAKQPAGASDAHRANRLTMVRGFAAYLRTIDPVHEVPPWGLLPSGQPRTGRPRGQQRLEQGVEPVGGPGFRAALADYLRIRRALGYKLTNDARALRWFVEFLEDRGAERVTIELALDWATMPETGAPAYLSTG